MKRISLVAGGSLGLVVAYHALRLAAGQCVGGGCDAYIPLSLLLPVAMLVSAGVSGLWAMAEALRRKQGLWATGLGACTLLSIGGTVAAAVIWRDSPDLLVGIATVLIALTPVIVLVYGLRGRQIRTRAE